MYSKLKVPTLLLTLIALPVALASCAKYPSIGSVASTA
jgi:hypothetical protein